MSRTVLITGGARGMGRLTALALAAAGDEVLIADWEGEHGARTVSEIRAAGGRAEFLYSNVAEADSLRALADAVLERWPRLDVLINNAGISYPRLRHNSAGIEMHFAACHLGHFLLTRLLLARLKASAPARIIFVASEGHKACKGLDFDDLNNVALWRGRPRNHGAAFMAYARAKLAMLYTMRELAEQLNGSGVTVNAASPGYFVNTGIHREMEGVFRWLSALVFGLGSLFGLSSPEKGARTHIWLATAPELATVSGGYFENCRPKAMSPQADDPDARRRLWAVSESLCGLAPGVTAAD